MRLACHTHDLRFTPPFTKLHFPYLPHSDPEDQIMIIKTSMVVFAIIFVTAVIGFSPGGVSVAQERSRAAPESAQTLSPQLQNQIERRNVREAARVCGDACMSSPRAGSSRGISSGSPTTADYTCNGGNCSCAGAVDCVAMTKICAPATIGCNDYGCACKEGN